MANLLLGLVCLGVTAQPSPTPSALELKVERAARDFRIQVYNSFRTDRPEYDRRQQEGRKVLQVWKRNGRRQSNSIELIQWFDRAKQSSLDGQLADLPPAPEFVDKIVVVDLGPGSPEETSTDPETADDSLATEFANLAEGDNNIGTPDSPDSQKKGILSNIGLAIFGKRASGEPTDSYDDVTDKRTDEVTQNAELADTENTTAPLFESEIDVDELKAQVDGYNTAISAIFEIVSDDEPIDGSTLAGLVDEFEELTQRRRDLEPYLKLDTLSVVQRNHVGNLVSSSDILVRVYQKIDERLTEPSDENLESIADPILLKNLRDRVEQLLTEPIED